MIEFELYGIKFRFCFSFFASAAVMAALSDENIILPAMLACFLHELGHIAVMVINGVNIRSVKFYGAGIMITPRKKLLSLGREAAVLTAGCFVNILLFVLFRGSTFGYINLFLGVFNMLPAGGLDGGRLLSLCLTEAMPCYPSAAVTVCRLAGCLCAVLLLVSAAALHISNPTIYVSAAMMFISAVIGNY